MINRFRKVNNKLYRGSAPSVRDLVILKQKYGIKKIVSLDLFSGNKIHQATQTLDIKHIILPIEIGKNKTLIKFLRQNLYKLLMTDGPTFIHCAQGKDRTGLVIALFRCKYQGWSCGKALKEAKSLGFGVGIPAEIINLYMKLIKKACGCKNEDVNQAYDIVSNQREYPSDYTLDSFEQQSWSPYEDYRVKEDQFTNQYIDWPEQYKSREDYWDNDAGSPPNMDVPQIGQWNSSTDGIMGAGPSMVGSGTII